ncbi:uncharacterized protein A4U43_C07F10650 [Asparagus officinalis]|uniref:DYW domain-containing protein n=1 Tax=Asparagus officinalis TaxID=4686 RepID=A0A5P1EAZ2_ASPOF|nr:pentatricopeptide repeat-containing protein At3g16610-like [Asparagus officinalis]ONK63028.1 uncharacterized protein A4U43_C07F10650 [Asparagus officinalis]
MHFLLQLLIPSKPKPLTNPLLLKSLTTSTLPQTPSSSSSSPILNRQPNPLFFPYKTLFFHLKSSPDLQETRKLHALVIAHGHLHQNFSPVLGSQLVHTYICLNSLQEALLVFHHLPIKNSFAWNSVLKGLVDVGHFCDALRLYHSMMSEGLVADNFTYPLVLRACSGLCDVEQGGIVEKSIEFDRIHRGLEPNVYTKCALLDMYAKCGRLMEARRVFDGMPVKDMVLWGAIICGTMQSGDWMEAMSLFRRMRWEGFRLDSVIVAMVIPACGKLGTLELGMGLHCCAMRSGFVDDLYVSNALIDMYAKCGHTHVASCIFQCMEFKDVVSWSSLIAGYSQNCEHRRSIDLFMEMVENGMSPSSVTLASVLPSLAELKLMKQAKEIHSYVIRHGFELDSFVASALLDLYCKCQSIKEAEFIFDIMFRRDIAIANSMITGYALSGDMESALRTLQRIRKIGLRPNSVTIVTVLPLCNRLTMLNHGKELHGYVLRGALDSEISVNNSLIDMYCKCGYLEHGKRVFEQMIVRDIITYNTVIGAFGMHGLGDQAILFFQLMKEERVHPDRVTFIALLSACSHSGLIEKGLYFNDSMRRDYGIVPDMEHYSCMVDLYGRAGYLDDAWNFIKKMPMEPGIDVLGSLLGACRVRQRIDLAELISNRIFEKKLEDPGYYVLMSNMYADAKRWEDVKKVRAVVKEKGLMKKPGISWIQIGWHVHSFLARDRSHPQFDKMCQIMVVLILDMKDEGYVPGIRYLYNLGGGDEDIGVTEITL